jgi:NIPSNAP
MRTIQTLLLAATSFILAALTGFAAEKDTRVYELRTYTSPPGKLDALHARFRDHTTKLFEKHGMTNIGYWTPSPNPENKLIYLLAYPSREARAASWKGFLADPDWKKAAAESEANGKIVSKVEARFMTATDFSPEFPQAAGSAGRLFELRILTATPGNLPALQARFRDPALALYAKHGIANLHLWQLMPDQKDADATFISLHAHADAAAAKASYAAFLADPAWIEAKKASEEKAGGSLTTVPDGIKSIFMKPTDYSPMK